MSLVRAPLVGAPLALGSATFGDRIGGVAFAFISALLLLATARKVNLKLTTGNNREKRDSGQVR